MNMHASAARPDRASSRFRPAMLFTMSALDARVEHALNMPDDANDAGLSDGCLLDGVPLTLGLQSNRDGALIRIAAKIVEVPLPGRPCRYSTALYLSNERAASTRTYYRYHLPFCLPPYPLWEPDPVYLLVDHPCCVMCVCVPFSKICVWRFRFLDRPFFLPTTRAAASMAPASPARRH